MAITILIYGSIFVCHNRCVMADINTAPLIALSLIVSILLAINVSDFTLVPVSFRYLPSKNLAMMLHINTRIAGME